jgi:hypothetical protein
MSEENREQSGADGLEPAVPEAGDPVENLTERRELDELDHEVSQLWKLDLGDTEMAVRFKP